MLRTSVLRQAPRKGRRRTALRLVPAALAVGALILLAPLASALAPGTITTIAGSAVPGPVPATSLGLEPWGLVADPATGGFYLSDIQNGVVRKVLPNGTVVLVAGNGGRGYTGDGAAATSAQLDQPAGLAVDAQGDLLIADPGSNVVRMVAGASGTAFGQAVTAGNIYTVAGNGTNGFGGDGAAATAAQLAAPRGVAVDGNGNLVVADTGNNRIRVVAGTSGIFYGQAMTAGSIYTVAGTGASAFNGDGNPSGTANLGFPPTVAVDADGNLVVADIQSDRIRLVAVTAGTFYGQAMSAMHTYTIAGDGSFASSDGAVATATGLGSPDGASVDAQGNVIILDTNHFRVRIVASTTGTLYGQSMTAGNIYTLAGNGSLGFGGDGGPATAAKTFFPKAAVPDTQGNVLIADFGNNRVRLVAGTGGTFYGQAVALGNIQTVVGNGSASFGGDGGPATAAQLGGPAAVSTDSHGNIVFSDRINHRIRVIAGANGVFWGLPMLVGNIYTVAGSGTIGGFGGDGGAAVNALLRFPGDVVVDSNGNLVIADTSNFRIRVVAGSNGTFYGQAMTVGHIYTVAGSGANGYGGDGGPATAANFATPNGVAVDPQGNILVLDTGGCTVRAVAATSGTFYGQAMTAGNIYSIVGTYTTCGFAGDGGPATAAQLMATGVTTDAQGNILVTDRNNSRLRFVPKTSGTFYGQAMTAANIYTVAGGGAGGDGGPAASASIAPELKATFDSAGNLLLPDDHRIRVVAAATGTFYGQAMTAGSIYTIAGTGAAGFGGDGGPALAARLGVQFGGVGVDANGNVLIADEENNRIRLVAGPSSDATLSALTISDGTLTPAFAAATTAYTDAVPNATTSATVTPTATDTNATIQVRVNGGGFSGVTSGSPSGALALNVGSNTIDVKVTAQDGTTTQTYTITVTRSAASSDANLSALTISAGTLTPAFAPGTTAYTDSVGFPVSSVTVTPTVNESHATVQAKVNAGGFTAVTSGSPSGPLALHTGVNTIQVKVTAQDGVTTKTYTISVTRAAPSSNANLSSLTISAGTLNPAFAPATTSYNAGVVANGVASVTVTPTAAVPGTIQVRVNGGTFATVASGSPSGPLALHNGVNTIQVKVTAQNGTTTKTYTITITRAANGGTVAGNFTCSGAFSGITVTGNLSVPAGATCVLLGGNVRGSVQAVNAAALQYDSVTVGGNVQITGLTGLPPGQVANSICRSTVRGSLQVTSNGRRISIGDNPPCAGGNRVDGAVQVTSNHALVRVSRNTIGGSLQCTGNSPATTGIAGSNTATGGKSGQCAGL